MSDRKKSLASQHSSCSSALDEDAAALRQELSSVAWIQCDNSNCLKWRKVRQEVAKELTNDMLWTCEMNENIKFSRCDIPEEDTALYDKLAKKVKLDLIKSELKPGTLVWAKVAGYCRWPSLVTADPANGEHIDGDDFEILWYHVEFLGGERSHGWVRTNFIDTFGPGNIDSVLKKTKEHGTYSQKINKKSRKSNKTRVTVREKQKITYKGMHTVKKAIGEAMTLLPLSLDKRLETCWFVWKGEGCSVTCDRDSTTRKNKQRGTVSKKVERLNKPSKKSSTARSSSCLAEAHDMHLRSNKRSSMHCCEKNFLTGRILIEKTVDEDNRVKDANENKTTLKESRGRRKKKIVAAGNIEVKENDVKKVENRILQCLDFSSSLLDTSKEERLLLDAQMYKRNEQTFEQNVSHFMQCNGLRLSSPPVWQSIEVSIFSIFLAVDERNGFVSVCDNHQWSSVYVDVMHQHSKQGGSLVKRFYKRNLYPFELHMSGQDYSLVIKELMQTTGHRKTKKNSSQDAGISNTSNREMQSTSLSSDMCESLNDDDEDFESPDIIKQLDELDRVLKSLENGQEKNEKDSEVSTMEADTKLVEYNKRSSVLPMLPARTGSEFGYPAEPEEKAQVVPDLDFPSSLDSSNNEVPESYPSGSQQVLHELQALQHDMDAIQDRVDVDIIDAL